MVTGVHFRQGRAFGISRAALGRAGLMHDRADRARG